MATKADPIGPRDRLWFGLFLALAAHATLILGIGLRSTEPQPHMALSVSLAIPESRESQSQPDLPAKTDGPIPVQQAEVKALPDSLQPELQPAISARKNPTTKAATLPQGLNRSQLIAAIADTPIEKPTALSQERIRRLDESSLTAATTDAEAAYLAMWRRKCERLGRVNYPPGNIQGELVMRVSIASSGQLNYVRIVRSSGSTLLDEAALKTVRQAAPYQPFSVEMRKAYDQLEFTRTWQYSKYGTGINR